ncbi:MAG TPA: hypothetical protein VHM91_02625, partial [Verrucomicrobiales bacterium]|nr:hypothetical protein [Verrucomicrobiales bacterium]
MNVLGILSSFGSILAIAAGLSARAQAAVLTIQQTAQYAYNAGFRGGSLVSAIAAAEAESAFDTEAVNNNLHQTTPGGQLLPGPDGRPVLLSMPRSGREMLPMDSIQALGDGRFGRVVGYCRGIWQFNSNAFRPALPDAATFDPVRSAATAWHISRHGRDWGKWVVFQNGTGWEPSRMARARAAARAIDSSVLAGTGNERAQARVTGGSIRETAGGNRIRALHAGDTGRVLAGPVKAAITQGPQTSFKLWWQVAWDSGPTGWVSEDLLIRSSTTAVQLPAPAFNGYPHNLVGMATNTVLSWESGANAATQKLYFGTSPTLGASDLKYTGLAEVWTPPAPLQPFTNYYWRVDSISAQGNVTAGPAWQFLTKPALPPALTLTGATASSSVLQ